jgi:Fur family ferric uptake transcriptional regulator
MTKARIHVLETIAQAKEPVSARQLCGKFQNEHDPATIYRALHYLEEKGRLDSFILHCSEHGTERYYVLHVAEHRHWFHCERCHRFTDLGLCQFDALVAKMSAEKGLIVTSHTFYATGVCPDCRAKTQVSAKTSG